MGWPLNLRLSLKVKEPISSSVSWFVPRLCISQLKNVPYKHFLQQWSRGPFRKATIYPRVISKREKKKFYA